MRNISRAVVVSASSVLFASLSIPLAQAQFGRGAGSWNTAGADAQRTSWARNDNRISASSMPGFSFLWKVKATNDAKGQYSISSAVMVDSYIGYRGFRSYAFLAGASNNAIALDSDVGRIEWSQNLGPTAAQSTAACPGALTAGVARPGPLAPVARGAAAAGGRGGGGGRGAASGVSEPEAGAITIGQGRGGGGGGGRGASGAIALQGGGRGVSGAGGRGGGGGARPPEAVYTVSTDGMLRTLYISNGANAKPPVRFLPANANATGLMLVDNVIYASTSGNCGGAPNGVWAMDISVDNPTPIHWSTNGGGVAGTVGPALGSDGSVYAATGDGDYTPASLSDSVVVLEAKTLKLKDWFTPGKSEFTSSPVVFPFKDGDKDKDLIAVANKDGHIYLLDSTALGGPDHKTPLSSIQYANSGADAGALASWEDSTGTRWVLVGATGALGSTRFPVTNGSVSGGAIAAFKVVAQGGKPTLQAGWISRDIAAPLAPIVVNGIVFSVATGAGSKPAVLYAMDGVTGKELFNSGTTIAGPVLRSGGLAVSAGQMYIATADSTIYTFGIPLVPPALAEKNK